jgi:hypothetical protein
MDKDGNVIVGADGQPIDDSARAEADSEAFVDLNPDVPRIFDFEPGSRERFVSAFENEGIGGFPQQLQRATGTMKLVDLSGRRMLRSDEQGGFTVVLSEPLPERFTIEFDYLIGWWGTFENGGFMIDKRVVPVRISVDGSHAKLYISQQRVADVRNARLERSDRLQFRVSGRKERGQEKLPSYIGDIRIAAL